MVKIIMHGCCGHMGQVISDLVAKQIKEILLIRYLPILKNVRQRQMS